jgi:hypothetical protein
MYVLLLMLALAPSPNRPPVNVSPKVSVSESQVEALVAATNGEHPVAIDIDILGSDVFGLGEVRVPIAMVHGLAKKTPGGACRGTTSLYEFEQKWQRVTELSYIVISPGSQCEPKTGGRRIILTASMKDDDVVAIAAAIRDGRVWRDEKGTPNETHAPLLRTNAIKSVDEDTPGRASVLTADEKGEEQSVLVVKIAEAWWVVDAGRGLSWRSL